jgi:hypothetical protein
MEDDISNVGGTSTLHLVLKGTEYFTIAFGTMVGVGWVVVIGTG